MFFIIYELKIFFSRTRHNVPNISHYSGRKALTQGFGSIIFLVVHVEYVLLIKASL